MLIKNHLQAIDFSKKKSVPEKDARDKQKGGKKAKLTDEEKAE